MNRRRLAPFCLALFLPICLLTVLPARAFAQGNGRPQRAQQPAGREQRPAADDFRVEQATPEIKRILRDWEIASGKFNKLKGKHYRWVYDFVFNVEKRSQGGFYFQAPDMGRIDVDAWKDQQKPRSLDKNGKPLKAGAAFSVQPDKEEQWISDGKEIIQVDVAKKEVNVFPIPQEIRGESITDSPLPFLFGMKADKAERRYHLQAGNMNNPAEGRIHLIAYPRLAKDAQNWSRAEVMLDARTFYPQAIKLIDPGGNSETVYKFYDIDQPSLFDTLIGNPFAVNQPRFKRIVHTGEAKMPRLIGQHWKKTKTLMEQAGYEVKLRQGKPAPNAEQVYHIYEQSPKPDEPLSKDKPIILTLYVKTDAAAASARPTRRTSARPTASERK